MAFISHTYDVKSLIGYCHILAVEIFNTLDSVRSCLIYEVFANKIPFLRNFGSDKDPLFIIGSIASPSVAKKNSIGWIISSQQTGGKAYFWVEMMTLLVISTHGLKVLLAPPPMLYPFGINGWLA